MEYGYPPMPEEQARETHATIVSGANTLLRGDRWSNHSANDPQVIRDAAYCERTGE